MNFTFVPSSSVLTHSWSGIFEAPQARPLSSASIRRSESSPVLAFMRKNVGGVQNSAGRLTRGLIGTAIEECNDGCLKLLEGLVRTGRRLQSSPAIDQKNRWVTRDVPIELGDFPAECEKRVTHGDLFHILPLYIDVLV